MNLPNRFDQEDKIIAWGYHPYSVISRININCSLHHIDGRKKPYHASICNSVMLTGEEHKYADGHNVSDEDYKKYLTSLALPVILNSGYKLKKIDYEYLESIADRLQKIKVGL